MVSHNLSTQTSQKFISRPADLKRVQLDTVCNIVFTVRYTKKPDCLTRLISTDDHYELAGINQPSRYKHVFHSRESAQELWTSPAPTPAETWKPEFDECGRPVLPELGRNATCGRRVCSSRNRGAQRRTCSVTSATGTRSQSPGSFRTPAAVQTVVGETIVTYRLKSLKFIKLSASRSRHAAAKLDLK